mgnify:CR=1 FL=1|tara:strand:+ start:64 stop:453 length:390 start_codon:yes stop_codon:yes gene_type:complete
MKIALSLVSLFLIFLSFNVSSEEKMEFKLYRDKGVLLFNTGQENNHFWVSIQAAAQGGGEMYAQITEVEFNQVWSGKKDVTDFYPLFNRSYNRQKEEAVEMANDIDKAISLHLSNLGSNSDPVKSVVSK